MRRQLCQDPCQDRQARNRGPDYLSKFSRGYLTFALAFRPICDIDESSLPSNTITSSVTRRFHLPIRLRCVGWRSFPSEKWGYGIVLNRKMSTANIVPRCHPCHVPYASLRTNLCLTIVSTPRAMHNDPSSHR